MESSDKFASLTRGIDRQASFSRSAATRPEGFPFSFGDKKFRWLFGVGTLKFKRHRNVEHRRRFRGRRRRPPSVLVQRIPVRAGRHRNLAGEVFQAMAKQARSWVGVELSGGRYRLVSRLGEGAMGTVYRATDRNLDAEVVVKIPLDTMLADPDFAPRFDREIRALVKLSHPHIVKVSDVGNHEGTPFAIMQYLRGGDMDNRRPKRPDGSPAPMPPESLVSWLEDIANALDFMHAKGYIHRDIKPTNILFDDNNEAYLADFGVVGALANTPAASTRALTAQGLVIGTPEYMAPEIIRGKAFDGRADQYSLAVMVYELLAGRRPFEGNSATDLIVMQSTEPPPPLRELAPHVSEGLARVIHQALEKQPARRFKSCSEFAQEVVAEASKSASPRTRQVPCPSCGKVLKVADTYAGKRLRCSTCKTPLEVLNDLSLVMVQDSGSNAALKLNIDDRPPTPPATARPGTPRRVVTQKIDRDGLNSEGPTIPRPDSSAKTPPPSGQPAWKIAASIAAAAVLVGVAVYLLLPKTEPIPKVEVAKLDTPERPELPAPKAAAPPQPKQDSQEEPQAKASINASNFVESPPEAEANPPNEPAPEPEKVVANPPPEEAANAVAPEPKVRQAALVQVDFVNDAMRVGQLPPGWAGTLIVTRDPRNDQLGLGLADRQAIGEATVLFDTIESEFVCEFEFVLPKPREGALFDLFLSGKAGKDVRQMLRLEFNTAAPGQFFCHASKKKKAYACNFRDNAPMRVRLERSKGKQLEMTLNGKPVDNFHPVLFGSIDRAMIGLKCIAFDLHPRVSSFMITK